MIEMPMDVLRQFPVRKTKKQKESFREAVLSYGEQLGYDAKTESDGWGCVNVIFGNPEKAKYLITAHYDTCARMFLPNFITPCNFWVFMAYQIVITLVMLLPALLIGVITGYLLQDYSAGYYVGYLAFLATFALMIAGPANQNNANDNTSGVVTVLTIMERIPKQFRDQVCFVLFDMEEAGLIGSASYRKIHKNASNAQIVLNFDCVGDGDLLIFFPTRKLRRDSEKMDFLRSVNGTSGVKELVVKEKGFYIYPSDQRNFPYGVGIAAFHTKRGIGPYCSRIHTSKDTILDENNVKFLCDRLLEVITVEERILV